MSTLTPTGAVTPDTVFVPAVYVSRRAMRKSVPLVRVLRRLAKGGA